MPSSPTRGSWGCLGAASVHQAQEMVVNMGTDQRHRPNAQPLLTVAVVRRLQI